MTEHHFIVWLTGEYNIGEDDTYGDLMDRLYEVANDCTCGLSKNRCWAEFDREAETLEDAMASAVRDVMLAGGQIEKIFTGMMIVTL